MQRGHPQSQECQVTQKMSSGKTENDREGKLALGSTRLERARRDPPLPAAYVGDRPLLQPNSGCELRSHARACYGQYRRTGRLPCLPLACVAVECDGVGDFLCVGGELAGRVLDKSDVGAPIGVVVVEPPDTQAGAGLTGLEGGVEGGFGHCAATGEDDHGGEGSFDCSIAVSEGYGDRPGTFEAEGGLRGLGLGGE